MVQSREAAAAGIDCRTHGSTATAERRPRTNLLRQPFHCFSTSYGARQVRCLSYLDCCHPGSLRIYGLCVSQQELSLVPEAPNVAISGKQGSLQGLRLSSHPFMLEGQGSLCV